MWLKDILLEPNNAKSLVFDFSCVNSTHGKWKTNPNQGSGEGKDLESVVSIQKVLPQGEKKLSMEPMVILV